MDWYVTVCCLIAGMLCFLIYIINALVVLNSNQHQAATSMAAAAKAISSNTEPKATAADYTQLLDAASRLTESLSKAGPSLVSLIGAILFVLIAAISSGALKH